MEDREIVKLYLEKDEKAIQETKSKYENYCFSISYNILHDRQDVDEVLNDTYLATWNAIPPAHPENLSTFIGKITRRLSINRFRSNKALKRGGEEVTLSFEELEDCIGDNSFNEQLQNQLLADTINQFLSEIKESDRKIFVCRYYYFDSIEDISKRFFYTKSKVKMSLKRTRDKLKEYLIMEGDMK